MKKNISILLLTIFIIPSVAFASWWNPTSWRIFGFLHRKDVSINVQNNEDLDSIKKIEELQKQIEELKSKQLESVTNNSAIVSVKDEVKAQVEKELKARADQGIQNINDKTLSEQVGVSKESLTSCIKNTDAAALQSKIASSVESAMKAVPSDQRGTPYAIVIGSNGVKAEIRGALPVEGVKQIIEQVKSGKVTIAYGGEVVLQEVGDHMIGNANASVKVIEYSDLECPYCKIFHTIMKQVVVDSNGDVSWVYRHWPIHQNSFEKLVAAECVAKLKGNDAFWKYVDLLFGMINTSNDSVTGKL
jgi:hypothetical protein